MLLYAYPDDDDTPDEVPAQEQGNDGEDSADSGSASKGSDR